MTTLFTREEKPVTSAPSGAAVVLYAFSTLIWLGLTIRNFHDGRHRDIAWVHLIAALLFLFSTALCGARWLKERRAF